MAQTSLPAIADLIDGATPSANTQTQAKSFFTGLRAWAAAWLNLGGTHTAGYVLTNTGSGSDPTWQAPAGASCFFSASNGPGTDVTGDGTAVHAVSYAAETYDTCAAFDSSTGVFTVPANGYYVFQAEINLSGITDHTQISTFFTIGGNPYGLTYANLTGINPYYITNSFMRYLTASSTVKVTFAVSGGTGGKVVDLTSVIFSGYRIG